MALILVCGLGSVIYAEHLPVKTYTVADGLLRDSGTCIRQDSRGFLWFCTAEGISRFDGIGMTNFTVADGLPNHFVEDFLETKSGTIYVATDQGLARKSQCEPDRTGKMQAYSPLNAGRFKKSFILLLE